MARWLVTAAALLALALPAEASSGRGFVLDRTSAQPNDRVTVRTAAFEPGVRLYLVRRGALPIVRSRLDPRLSFVGTLANVRSGRGALTFSMPPLDAGTYELGSWSRGRGFAAHPSARLELWPKASCPVTRPNGNRPPNQPRMLWYGNGLLWAGLSADGTYSVPRERVAADGSIGNKLPWVTTPRWEKPSIAGERIDAAAPPLRVLGVNRGSFSSSPDPSYMSAVSFPTPGCWRLSARIADVSLTYVVRVEVVEP
jgi:hypothetical protein